MGVKFVVKKRYVTLEWPLTRAVSGNLISDMGHNYVSNNPYQSISNWLCQLYGK